LGLLFPKYGKIKNVPNHQPEILFGVLRPEKESSQYLMVSEHHQPWSLQTNAIVAQSGFRASTTRN
jgi:hypothetical protein